MPIEGALLAAVGATRRATLVTIGPGGRARPVPICFVAVDAPDGHLVLHSPIDRKPKAAADPTRLARVRDIVDRPEVAILVDHWSEDWSRLWWVRLTGRARILAADDLAADAEREIAIGRLRSKYRQYRAHDLEALPILRIDVDAVTGWGAPTPPRGEETSRSPSAGGSVSSSSPGDSRRR